MAYLYRLALILFFCLPAFVGNANAATYNYPPNSYQVSNQYGTNFNTASEACTSYASISGTSRVVDSVTDGATGATCNWRNTVNGTTGSAFLPHVNNQCSGTDQYNGTTGLCAGTCNSPNVVDGSYCHAVCPSPSVFDTTTGTCKQPCSAGSMSGYSTTGLHSTGTSLPSGTTVCVDGCVMSTNSNGFCYKETASSPYACFVTYGGQTGASCTGSNTAQPTPSPDPDAAKKDCVAKGGSFGTINGVTTCVPRTSTGAAEVKTPSTSTNTTVSGGNTTNVTNNSTTTTNLDGSITTTTTTTTTVNGGTPTTSTSTGTQSAADYCKDHPAEKLCKDNNSSFGGACGAFTCDGDAIQCAIARKIHQNQCDYVKDTDDAKTEIQGKAAYTTGQKLMNNDYDQDVKDWLNKSGDNSRTVDIPSSLSESGAASFSGDAIQDYHGTVMGKSFTVPFSSANTYFNYFGYILLGLTYLACYKYIASVV